MDQRWIDGKKHIVFVAYYPDPHLLKKARAIRKDDNVFLTFIGGCIRGDTQIDTCFDQSYEYKTFHDFFDLVQRSAPFSWHAAAPLYHAAMIIAANDLRTHLVVDILDPLFFVRRDSEQLDVKLEATVLKHADRVVHKMPEEAWAIIDNKYNLGGKGVSVQSYPEVQLIDETVQSNHSGNPHAVYAGSIVPYRIAMEQGHQNHVFDPLIELADEDTFELSIFVNQNARDMPWHQHKHYFKKAEQNKWFHFKKGVPYHRVASVLSKYSTGIFFDNIPISSYRPEHFKYNIASKFFTYLESGLPIVVYEEAEYMARLVRRYNLGALYSAWDPQTIIDAIRSVGLRDYSSAIRSFCNQYPMDKYGPLLAEIHGV